LFPDGPICGLYDWSRSTLADEDGAVEDDITMPDAQNASSGFALRTYPDPNAVKVLAQRGPDEAPERLRAEARRG